MSKNAYLQECQWCGKQYRLATKLKYCCDECRDAAADLKKKMMSKHKNITIDDVLEIHRKGLDKQDLAPAPEEIKDDKPKRNPFLRKGDKILFPVRYTSGAIRWEWINIEDVESGVKVI